MTMVVERGALVRFLVFVLIVVAAVYYVISRPPAAQRRTADDEGRPTAAEPARDLPPVASPVDADFFVDYRIERERVRSQQLELLRELVNNPQVDETVRRQANEQWLRLTDDLGKELEIEGLVKAKGYQDAIVFLGHNSAQVVVRVDALTAIDVARIADVVTRTAGIPFEQITVVARPPRPGGPAQTQ